MTQVNTEPLNSSHSADKAVPYLNEFKNLLTETIGLKTELIQDGVLRGALAGLARSHPGEPAGWLKLLRSDRGALQDFCDQFTVGETWFFRDWTPFVCLRDFLRESKARDNFVSPIRILCVPSSTGEEPWSVAMILAAEGLKPNEVMIDAVDINRASLATMVEGKYPSYSRRENNLEANALLNRFTQPTYNGFRIDPVLTGYSRTHQGNILAPNFDPTGCGAKYQIIFSRNLFIYLDPESKKKGVANLIKLLHPQGLLYLGHAEGSVADGQNLKRWKEPYLFGFTPKQFDGQVPNDPKGLSWVPRPAFSISKRKSPVSRPLVKSTSKTSRLPDTDSSPGDSSRVRVQDALNAANFGNLDLAATLYEELVNEEPLNSQYWLLAATVEQARGRTQDALRMFDRVLYLDPKNSQALRMVALIHRQLGQNQLAEQMERRLANLAPKDKRDEL